VIFIRDDRRSITYWSRTIYAVSIETAAPLQTTAKHEQIKWCWMKNPRPILMCIIKKVMVPGNWWKNFWLEGGRNSRWIF